MKSDEMKPPIRAHVFNVAALPKWLQRMFNLNDSRWGRGDDKPNDAGRTEGAQPPEDEPVKPPTEDNPSSGRKNAPAGGPPDLDELWRDFNRKLGGLFG